MAGSLSIRAPLFTWSVCGCDDLERRSGTSVTNICEFIRSGMKLPLMIFFMSRETKEYTEGWNTDEGRDSTLEYRLSIFSADAQDSGVYSCMTPARHAHAVVVEVKAVHCGEITPRRGLALSTTATQMGTKVQFSCNNGNALIGTPEIVCLASGNWSSSIPICESE